MDAVGGKIHETDFAKMLLSYSGISEQRQKKMVKRIKLRFQGDTSKVTFRFIPVYCTSVNLTNENHGKNVKEMNTRTLPFVKRLLSNA